MDDSLKFDLSFGGVNIDSIKEAWAKDEAKIQSSLNSLSKLTVPVDSSKVVELNKTLAQTEKMLSRISKMQTASTKPLTSFQAGKLDIAKTEAARLTEQRLQTEIARTAAAQSRAEKTALSLAASKDKLTGAQNRSISSTNKSTSAWQAQGFALNGIKQTLGAYASVLGAMRLFSNIREVTAEFELQRVALGAIIQDKAKADQLFSQITQLAVQSPFQVKELITYTKELSAYRIETDQLYDTTKRLADISAGLGVDMGRLILAYGQVSAASVLRGQELRQFTEAGIPLVSLLAEKFSELRGEMVSTGEVFELISDRAVSFGMVKEIFADMTNVGGTFYNMQKIQAETLAGSWSNLKDEIALAMNAMGQENYGAIKTVIDLTKELWQNWEEVLDVLTMVALGYGAYKIATISVAASQARTNILLKDSIGLKYKDILATAKQTIATENLKTAANGMPTKRGVWGMATGENTKEIIAAAGAIDGGLTPAMARNAIQLGQTTAAQRKYMIQLGILTKEEVKNALAVRGRITLNNLLALSFGKVGTGIQALGTALKSMLPLLAIGAIISAISSLWSGAEKLLGLNSDYTEAIDTINTKQKEFAQNLKTIDNKFQAAYSSAKKLSGELGNIGSKQSLQAAIVELKNLQEQLAEFNLGGIVNIADVNIDNIVNKYNEVRQILENSNKWGVMFATRMEEGFNAVEGVGSVFGENLKSDMEQFNKALSGLFMQIDFGSSFEVLKQQLKSIYPELTQTQKIVADTFIAKRKETETEEGYNIRLMQSYSKLNELLDLKAKFAGTFTNKQKQQFNEVDSAIKKVQSTMSEYGKEIDKVVKDTELKFGKAVSGFNKQEQAALIIGIKTFFADPKHGLNVYAQTIGAQMVAGKLHLPMNIVPTITAANTSELTQLQKMIKDSGLFPDLTVEQLQGINNMVDATKVLNDKASEYRQILKDTKPADKGAYEQLKAVDAQKERTKLQVTLNAGIAKESTLLSQINRLTKQRDEAKIRPITSRSDISTRTQELREIDSQIKQRQNLLKVTKEQNAENTKKLQQPIVSNSMDFSKYTKRNQDAIDQAKKGLSDVEKLASAIGVAIAKMMGGGTDPRIAALKTEIALVQEAYKKYQDLEKQIGSTKAQEKITKLYDNVFKKFKQLEGATPVFSDEQLKNEIGRALKIGDKYLSDSDKLKLNMDISDTDLAAMSNKLKSALDKLQSEIEEQQKANDFFEAMLGMTGDSQLAADVTIGIYGAGFEDTAAKIKEQLTKAFEGIDISLEVGGDVIDYSGLMKKIEGLPGATQDAARKMVQSLRDSNTKAMLDLYKSLGDYSTYQYKRLEIARKAQKQLADIQKLEVPEEEKERLEKSVKTKQAKDFAKLGFDEFKESELYTTMFEKIEYASKSTLEALKRRLLDVKSVWGSSLDPTQIKELVQKLEQVDSQLTERNPFKTLTESAKRYKVAIKEESKASRIDKFETSDKQALKSQKVADTDAQALAEQEAKLKILKEQKSTSDEQLMQAEVELGIRQTISKVSGLRATADKAASETASKRLKDLDDEERKMGEGVRMVGANISHVGDMIASIGSLAEMFGADEEMMAWIDSIGQVVSGIGTMSEGVADIMKGDVFAGVSKVVTGLVDTIAGVFNATYIQRVAAANGIIKEQADLIEKLGKDYAKLQKQESKTLGEDYIKNQQEQIQNLKDKEEATRKQLEAERSKGKKADKDAAAGFEKALVEAAEAAAEAASEMSRKITEAMTETDVTSLAKTMAKSWLDSYIAIGRQGAITTGEMKQQWKDMMKTMVANSLLARAVQAAFEPVFKDIDKIFEGGRIPTTAEINGIIDAGMGAIDILGVTLPKLLEGLDLGKLDATADGLTGIAKNIAQASEDQITGLAAGINTQNAYFAQTVTLATNIYALMQKWDEQKSAASQGTTLQSLIIIQQTSLAHLRAIETNTGNTASGVSEILSELRSIIKPKGVPASKVVKTELS